MSDGPVHARVAAVKEIGHGVASYGRAFEAALSSARRDVNRAAGEFQLAVADSGRALNQAERRTVGASAALAACREGCEPLARELAEARVAEAEARRRHQRNLQAKARFDRTASELVSSMRTAQTAAEATVPAASQRIREYAEILTSYLASGASR